MIGVSHLEVMSQNPAQKNVLSEAEELFLVTAEVDEETYRQLIKESWKSKTCTRHELLRRIVLEYLDTKDKED